MECSQCKTRPATMEITQQIDGKEEKVHLCTECAHKNESALSLDTFSLEDLLTSLFNIDAHELKMAGMKQEALHNLACDRCKTTFNTFRKTGKFGCSKCYEAFDSRLDATLKRVHSGHVTHQGKSPNQTLTQVDQIERIEELKTYLSELIKEEAFEEAAVVRDEIKKLNQTLKDEAGE